ncbi:hypothetical protein IT774_07510 [Salinimonas marina]|uniref:Uncharacterized protein n=1 Tax=Salinimonas marina TaxID=2785918 RepID=A0A7S9DZS3_9ALTE|nr:hypothetical protein [Salinimonas marina]QPG06941.1 hypothetical protein IT774_07510 [Salinimonas marina]
MSNEPKTLLQLIVDALRIAKAAEQRLEMDTFYGSGLEATTVPTIHT